MYPSFVAIKASASSVTYKAIFVQLKTICFIIYDNAFYSNELIIAGAAQATFN